jgi:Ca2+-binding EF-hand superfamily protein
MKLLAGSLLLSIAAVPAYAETIVSVDERGLVAFVHLDSDHNGYVSRVEARSVAGVERAFDTADANRDGLLDQGEYTQVRQVREEQ